MLCASRRRSGCSSSPPPDPAAERSRASKAGARSDPNPASQPRLEPIQGRKTFHLAKSPAPAYVKTRVRQAARRALHPLRRGLIAEKPLTGLAAEIAGVAHL